MPLIYRSGVPLPFVFLQDHFLQHCRDIMQYYKLLHLMKMRCLKLKTRLFQMKKEWPGSDEFPPS
uniref:Putative ovule protein n=1 Tax=Solanum chacoense TaxID=4108 RepID=A0A0V0GWL4_SOLCH